ncbi:MAG TPA: hypothetical protein VF540_01315, partial [Segetibacter sp.]
VTLYGGVGNYDMMSLQKDLAAKQVSISPFIGQYSEGISGGSTQKTLQPLFNYYMHTLPNHAKTV